MARVLQVECELEALAQVTGFRAGKWAELLGVSPRQLHRECRRVFGCSPHELLDKERMKAVEKFLAASPSVKDAASVAGFEESSNFCRWFKARKHMTPLEYAARVTSTLQSVVYSGHCLRKPCANP